MCTKETSSNLKWISYIPKHVLHMGKGQGEGGRESLEILLVRKYWKPLISLLIIQQARAMPIYGQKAIVICNRYPAIYVDHQDRPKSCKAPHNHSYSRYKKRFVDNLLNNKTIILLNLAEYRLILANSAYGLIG